MFTVVKILMSANKKYQQVALLLLLLNSHFVEFQHWNANAKYKLERNNYNTNYKTKPTKNKTGK